MERNTSDSDDGTSLNRRKVLKTAVATTAGLGLASGTAAANTSFQVNFCGCSQICVNLDTDSTQWFTVLIAQESDEDGWEFSVVRKQ